MRRGPSPETIEQARLRAANAVETAVERVPVIGTVIEAGQRERATGGGLLAGGLAYRFFFWLVPTGLAAAAIAHLSGFEAKQDLSRAASGRGLGALVASAEQQAMASGTASPWVLLVTGLVFAVWFGIGVVRALAIVHALAWGLPIRKVRGPLLAGAVFTVIAAVLTLMGTAISRLVHAVGLGPVAFALSIISVYAVVGFGLTAVFPHPPATPRALLPGALLIGVGGFGLQLFVNVYLAPKVGRSANTYGILGVATVILLWLFIIARLITVSAFLNAQIWYRDHPPGERLVKARVEQEAPRPEPAADQEGPRP